MTRRNLNWNLLHLAHWRLWLSVLQVTENWKASFLGRMYIVNQQTVDVSGWMTQTVVSNGGGGLLQALPCGSCSRMDRGRMRMCVPRTSRTCLRKESVCHSRQFAPLTSTWSWLNVSRVYISIYLIYVSSDCTSLQLFVLLEMVRPFTKAWFTNSHCLLKIARC